MAKYHGTNVIRLEDLSWAKHTGKNRAGYFLTTWQVHWFHAKIQELIVEMASREGIRVEIVDPRDTSNRCSRCGELGRMTGKIFICEHCGFDLHADLSVARNIPIAPNSPTAIRGGGRCPLPPI
ncbi:MAG: zinc ribbon domain-containing protein [Candidatus Helarchaeota archaeon]